jgi:hypothetical protein
MMGRMNEFFDGNSKAQGQWEPAKLKHARPPYPGPMYGGTRIDTKNKNFSHGLEW